MICVSRCTVISYCLLVSTLLLTATTILVMAEEFEQLPISLQKFSSMLIHNRNCRNVFICSVIIVMSTSISLSLLACPNEKTKNYQPTNQSKTFKNIDEDDDYQKDQEFVKYLNSDRPIIISNLNIYENDFDALEKVKNRKEIILNLFLTATIHHNITLNGIDVLDILDKDCATECDEQKLKDIIIKYIDMSKNISDKNEIILSNNKTTNSEIVNCTSNNTDCTEKKLEMKHRMKRSIDSVNITDDLMINMQNVDKTACSDPEYIVFMWVLSLIALATALKLYYLIKTCLAVILVTIYGILIMEVDVFTKDDDEYEM